MSGYRLIICNNFAKEAKKIIEQEGLKELEVHSFPTCCSGRTSERSNLLNDVSLDEYDAAFLILSKSCANCILPDERESLPDKLSVHILDLCNTLLINESLLESYIKSGGYIVTPNWINAWRLKLDEWGFDQKTAVEFFEECMDKVVFLDTGVYGDMSNKLEEFAGYVKVETEIIPTGIDHFKLFLFNLLNRKKVNVQKKKHITQLARANRMSSDYAMSFDLMTSLINLQKEEDVIEGILNMFRMLFAPERVVFIPNPGLKPPIEYSAPLNMKPEDIEILLTKIKTVQNEYEWKEKNDGFYLLIQYQDQVFGLLDVEGFTYPEYGKRYLDIAVSATRICGLALIKARNIARLNRALEDIDNNLREKEAIEKSLTVKNRELDDFTHTVSHDLKNPINNIIRVLKVIQEKPELFDEFFYRVVNQANEMLDFINKLLQMSRAGKVIEKRDGIALDKVIRYSWSQHKDEKSELVMEEDIPLVAGDVMKLMQVFNNVVSNAIQNRDENKDKLILTVGHKTENGFLTLTFTDNGKGIEPDAIEKLFKPGFTLRKGGTGYGLSISQKIMKAHEGSMKIESEGLGMGAVVCLSFPLNTDK